METKAISKKHPADQPQEIDCEKMNCKILNLEGTNYYTFFTRKYEKKKNWEKPDPKKISSFIPGTISKVFVKDGDKVNEGDDLIILDAMKMQNRIKSHLNGTIKHIRVKEGDKVPKGFLMIEIK